MPRIYVTPSELSEMPLGLGLSGQIGQLATGVLDKLLSRASQRVDGFCQKRIGAPPSTTVGTGGIAQGGTSLPVASTLGIDNLAEQAVILNSGGGTAETILVQPGGLTVSSWTSPYAGTLTLATPAIYAHSAGETVQVVYKEVGEAGRASSADPYTEALQSQAAQLALAHLPTRHAGLTRVAFIKHYPIISILAVEHAYSFDNTYNPVDTSGISIEPTEGWYRFRVGQVILPEGLIRTTYTGGYQAVPDDVKIATSYYLADEFTQMLNPLGATDLQMGKRRQAWQLTKGKSPLVQMAEDSLKKYRRTV